MFLKQIILSLFFMKLCQTTQENEKTVDICPICQDPLIEIKTMKTPCDHKFCSECFIENFWERKSRTCPICRNAFRETFYVNLIENENLECVKSFISRYPEILNDGDGELPFPQVLEPLEGHEELKEIVRNYMERAEMLREAIKEGDYERVKLLIDQDGASPNVAPNAVDLPLITAIYSNNTKILQFLIDRGAKVNLENGEGLTALFEAVSNDNAEMVKILLENFADPNRGLDTVTNEGIGVNLIPIWRAESVEIAEILINAGAKYKEEDSVVDYDIDEDDAGSLLHNALKNKNLELAKFYLSKGLNVNFSAVENPVITPLSVLCDLKENFNLEIIEYFLEKGANPNLGEIEEYSLLQYAAVKNDVNLVKLLIKHGAKINAISVNGETPLQSFVRRKKTTIEMINLLMDNGANPFLKNDKNENAIQIAQKNENKTAAKILKVYQKRIQLKRTRDGNTKL